MTLPYTDPAPEPAAEPEGVAAFLAIRADLAEVIHPFLVRAAHALGPPAMNLIAAEAADAVLTHVAELEAE